MTTIQVPAALDRADFPHATDEQFALLQTAYAKCLAFDPTPGTKKLPDCGEIKQILSDREFAAMEAAIAAGDVTVSCDESCPIWGSAVRAAKGGQQ